MIVVSACLAGLKVRYNGSHRLDQRIEELVQEGKAVTVCPELLGGFSTPRPPAEIIGGDGHDVLRVFLNLSFIFYCSIVLLTVL